MYLIKYILAFIAFALSGMILTSVMMQKADSGFEGGPQLLLNGLISGLVGILITHLLVSKAGLKSKWIIGIYLLIILLAMLVLYSGILQTTSESINLIE
ncbi:MAG: hypothetical protein WED33_12295 [Bacteroidia bacterium]